MFRNDFQGLLNTYDQSVEVYKLESNQGHLFINGLAHADVFFEGGCPRPQFEDLLPIVVAVGLETRLSAICNPTLLQRPGDEAANSDCSNFIVAISHACAMFA